jgi:hypothetical protein
MTRPIRGAMRQSRCMDTSPTPVRRRLRRALRTSFLSVPAAFVLVAVACGGSEESTTGGTGAGAGAGAAGSGNDAGSAGASANAGAAGATSGTKGGASGSGGAAGSIDLAKGGASGSAGHAGAAGAAGDGSAGASGEATGGTAGTGVGGAAGAAGETQAQFCAGKGPPIVVGDNGKAVCTGAIAATTFRFGLCTCEGYVSSGKLTTDAFNSANGPYKPGQEDGAVGTNAGLNASNVFTIGGSLWVSGSSGIATAANVSVGGELHCGGDYVGSDLGVGDDAFVDGKLIGKDVTIGGTLQQPAGADLLVSGKNEIKATKVGAVDVEPPCDCRPEQLVDIAGFVNAKKNDNDNASIPLSPGELSNFADDKTIELPCGRYYLDQMTGAGRVTFHAKGRVALFIGGDISLSKGFAITVDDGAELDLFVGGNVNSASQINLGDAAHPAAVRIYVGGSGTINLSGGGVFTGNLYAPKAELVLAADTEFYGAVFARRVATAGDVTLHYDTAILNAGKDCPAPPTTGGAGAGGTGGTAGAAGQSGAGGTGAAGKAGAPPVEGGCTSCRDCQNQACNAGVCGSCQTNADCCSPLECTNGVCLPRIK